MLAEGAHSTPSACTGSAAALVQPRVFGAGLAGARAVGPSAASAGAPAPALSGLLGGQQVRWDSTKRKRAKKMNKHKYQKLKKKLRNLTAKNVRGKGK